MLRGEEPLTASKALKEAGVYGKKYKNATQAQWTQRALAWGLYVTLGAFGNLRQLTFGLQGRASPRTIVKLHRACEALSDFAQSLRKDISNIEK